MPVKQYTPVTLSQSHSIDPFFLNFTIYTGFRSTDISPRGSNAIASVLQALKYVDTDSNGGTKRCLQKPSTTSGIADLSLSWRHQVHPSKSRDYHCYKHLGWRSKANRIHTLRHLSAPLFDSKPQDLCTPLHKLGAIPLDIKALPPNGSFLFLIFSKL